MCGGDSLGETTLSLYWKHSVANNSFPWTWVHLWCHGFSLPLPSKLGLVVQKASVSVPMCFDTDAKLAAQSSVSRYPDGSIGEEWAAAGLGMGSTDLSLRVLLDTDVIHCTIVITGNGFCLWGLCQGPSAAWMQFWWKDEEEEKCKF